MKPGQQQLVYEHKKQELQIKVENTIQGLLSHGIEQLSDAQQAIDHIVSPGMINGVLQLGGAQYEYLLWAVRSMGAALDRAEQKLTYSDVTYVEGEIANGHKQPSG